MSDDRRDLDLPTAVASLLAETRHIDHELRTAGMDPTVAAHAATDYWRRRLDKVLRQLPATAEVSKAGAVESVDDAQAERRPSPTDSLSFAKDRLERLINASDAMPGPMCDRVLQFEKAMRLVEQLVSVDPFRDLR